MDEIPVHPRIPYGQADFRRIRLRKWLDVDKTRFLRRLEREDYVFLIRPRRFGKSLWVSLLENYVVPGYIPQTVTGAPAPAGARRRIFSAQGRSGARSNTIRWPASAPQRSI